MSNTSKQKGSGFELEVVRKHKEELKINAYKQPLSGALGGKFKCDVWVAGMAGECKRRKKNFTSLYKALEQDNADILFVRDDKQPILVVLPWYSYKLFCQWSKLAQLFPIDKESEVSVTDQQL